MGPTKEKTLEVDAVLGMGERGKEREKEGIEKERAYETR